MPVKKPTGSKVSLPGQLGTPPALSGGNTSLPSLGGQSTSAYGTDLTAPKPIAYSMQGNLGDISNVIKQVNQGQNQANVANNDRYNQLLSVLGNAAGGLNQNSQQAVQAVQQGYGSGIQQLQGSLANNQTVFANESQRATQDAMKNASHAQQSAISRGLGNTSITDAMQDQVQRQKNDAMANIAASKAQADNGVYQNLASMYANGGQATGQAYNQAGQNYFQGGGTIANAIASRNDVAPGIGDYAGVIQGAAAAQASGGKTTIRTTDPLSINSPLRSGGGASGGGSSGGLSGGISSSMGQGGYSGTPGTSGNYYGPGFGNPNDNPLSSPASPQMHPVGPITMNDPGNGEAASALKESVNYGTSGDSGSTPPPATQNSSPQSWQDMPGKTDEDKQFNWHRLQNGISYADVVAQAPLYNSK